LHVKNELREAEQQRLFPQLAINQGAHKAALSMCYDVHTWQNRNLTSQTLRNATKYASELKRILENKIKFSSVRREQMRSQTAPALDEY